MKKIHLQLTALLLLAAATLSLSSCVKDTAVKHFTMYTPLYKSLAQVQSEVKSTNPVAVMAPGKMYIIGNYIFLAEKNKGIHILDNTNPAAPVNKAFIPIPGNEDIAVTGNTLYADCYNNMFTINISNPMQAALVKTTPNLFPDRRNVYGFTIDSAHIIYDWSRKDTSVKTDEINYGDTRNGRWWGCAVCNGGFMTSPFSAVADSKSGGKGGSMARFTIMNNYLYTVTNTSINTVNISQPQQPVVKSLVPIGGGIETIYPFQDKLFIGSTTGMFIYSVANPELPTRLGAISHFRSCDPVITDGTYAYVTLHTNSTCMGNLNQLDIVDVQNLSQPRLVKSYQLTGPKGLSKDGKWLFICDGIEGLKCFDATNVNALNLTSVTKMGDTYDVICNNGIAVVSAADGLYQYDYSNTSKLRLLSKVGWSK